MARRGTLGVVLLACACAGAPTPLPPSAPHPLLGRPAPAWRGATLQGGHFAPAMAQGRVLVVEFFARYCGPCQRRLPAVERLRQELPDVTVVGVSLDQTPEAALAQVRAFSLRFPVIHDEGGVIAGRYRIAELPAAVVVGVDGRVLWAGGPGQSDQALRQAVQAARERIGPAGPRP